MLNLARDFNQDLSFPDAVFESHLSSCLGDNSSAFLGQLSSMNPDWKISLAQIFSKTHVKPAMSRHVEFCTFAIFFAQPKLMMYRYIYLLTHKKTTRPYTIAFVEKTELESQFVKSDRLRLLRLTIMYLLSEMTSFLHKCISGLACRSF